MEPTTFKEAHKVLNPPDGHPDVLPLPVFVHPEENAVISCWRMTWRERFSALFFGRTWVWVIGGNGTQPPISVTSMRSVFRKKQ